MEYLTSEQALADLAFFVASMNEEYKLSSDVIMVKPSLSYVIKNILLQVKWIAFGGSYPGSLAAWARLKYPHLISGSVSTSGPLLAIPDFQGKVAFPLTKIFTSALCLGKYLQIFLLTKKVLFLFQHTLE